MSHRLRDGHLVYRTSTRFECSENSFRKLWHNLDRSRFEWTVARSIRWVTDIMISPLGFAHRSYLKTTLACLVLVPTVLLTAFLALHWFPKVLGPVAATLGVIVALGSATLASAGTVVLLRCKRDALGQMDLFLSMNRSRDPAAIKGKSATRSSRVQRWFARAC